MKNSSINILKAVAAFLVVTIHCSFPGATGKIISNLARISVPIFLLISGFYSYNNTKEKVRKKIWNICKLIILSNLVYIIYIIISKWPDIKTYFYGIINQKNLIKILVFNENPFRTHLWYLNAVLYCYLFYYIYVRFIKDKIKNNKVYKYILYIAILLLLFYVLITIFYINKVELDQLFILRNFIFVGIPFFIIGNMINKYKCFERLENKKLYIIMVISIIVILIESKFYLSELFLGNIFLSISIFTFCIKNPNIFKLKHLELIGEKYSLYIYILHPLLKDILNYGYEIIQITNNFMLFIKPILLIIISIIISKLIESVQKKRTLSDKTLT